MINNNSILFIIRRKKNRRRRRGWIIMRFPCAGVHIHSNDRQNLPRLTLVSQRILNFSMQYHKPHQIKKQKRGKEVVNHELSTVHRSCEACEKGHVHPPLETQGQHIERPRSTLSPVVGKPAEIWTPDKAIAVAKQLKSGTLKRPSTAPVSRRVPNSSPTVTTSRRPVKLSPSNFSPQNSKETATTRRRPRSAFTETPKRIVTVYKKNLNSTGTTQNNSNTSQFVFSTPYVRPTHTFQYPKSSAKYYLPTPLDAIGPLCRRVWSKHYVCICGTCGEREDAEDRKEKAKEALRIQNLLKLQEEARIEKARAEEKKRKAEIRRKEKEMKQRLIMLRKNSIYLKCTCFTKISKRYESKSNNPKHLPSCPIRNLAKHTRKHSKMNLLPLSVPYCSP